MRFNFKDFNNNRKNKFGRLGLWYILALCAIATTIILGQILIQHHLHNQRTDSRVVNVAGRQRMLSQKITKLSILLQGDVPQKKINRLSSELHEAVEIWQISHEGLKNGNEILGLPGSNSPEIEAMFNKIQLPHDSIIHYVNALLGHLSSGEFHVKDDVSVFVVHILKHEKAFLAGMDKIVNQYDIEASGKVSMLSRMEYLLLLISLVVILLEALFIFRPTALNVSKTMNKLIDSEQHASKMAKEISAIYNSLEKSYEQLAKVNEPDDIPKLWAKADRGGGLIQITDAFHQLTSLECGEFMRICDLFPGSGLGDEFMDDLVDTIADLGSWSGQIQIKHKQREIWVEITICPVLGIGNNVREVLVIGTDITHRKRAEQDMSQKNRNDVEKRINQQKYRSVLILEGQEEERKRLAMDIHDGIGQLLTSLKFQLEAINPMDGKANLQKLTEIKDQLRDTIKEVRRVTFNLRPTVLGDYGLAAGLKLFTKEISKYSNITIGFQNPDNLTERFSQRIENNVFRIVQEAINNAIKYAEASSIDVSLKMQLDELVIFIKDDGVGFDPSNLNEMGIESGSGFFNMYERTEYINGKLEIDSVAGQGTIVELHVPVKQKINV